MIILFTNVTRLVDTAPEDNLVDELFIKATRLLEVAHKMKLYMHYE